MRLLKAFVPVTLLLALALLAFLSVKLFSVIGRGAITMPPLQDEGGADTIKDVTSTLEQPLHVDLNLIEEGSKDEIIASLKALRGKMEGFSLSNFVQGARKSIAIVVEAIKNEDHKVIGTVADPGLVRSCLSLAAQLSKTASAQIEEGRVESVYLLNDKAFITLRTPSPDTRWTFSKHTHSSDPQWYLSNVSL